MNKYILILVAIVLFTNCTEHKEINAQTITDNAITVSGGDKIKNSTINFDFRNRHYKAVRNNGNFQFERQFKDSLNNITDVLSNDGYKRFINNELVKVADSMIPRYSASVNSVHYFSVLPFGLNDAAVNKEFLNDVEIKGNTYHKIKITFNQEGGGEDFEDVFVYWINTKTFKTDYIAYSYIESDGVGLRFREAFNERFVNGIRFVDYNNYKATDTENSVLKLDEHYKNNTLKFLSKIELKQIKVN